MPPLGFAKSFYVDDLLYDRGLIEALVRFFGDTQVMVGSDYPFQIMDAEPDARVSTLALGEGVSRLIRHDNAARWLGLAG